MEKIKNVRVMAKSQAKNFLRPIPNHTWEYVKQIEEYVVSESITDFGLWHPHHFEARIDADFFINVIGELLQRKWIDIA